MRAWRTSSDMPLALTIGVWNSETNKSAVKLCPQRAGTYVDQARCDAVYASRSVSTIKTHTRKASVPDIFGPVMCCHTACEIDYRSLGRGIRDTGVASKD
jgi:hypothetical protein